MNAAFVVLLTAISNPVAAADCPDLGLSGAKATLFCAEFKELLYAPYKPEAERDSTQPSDTIKRILESDSLWGEVHRADPKKTLALISRIRDAGGLSEY
ncbi:hypothetical protein [Dinoroseobacter sp. S76]|uniref:hypothetical protein n=1 Tax=Dinoroseobacter sp. S76 TaxID=3415124 RepID=UPI003C7BDF49